jgi:hypothetical protein
MLLRPPQFDRWRKSIQSPVEVVEKSKIDGWKATGIRRAGKSIPTRLLDEYVRQMPDAATTEKSATKENFSEKFQTK